MTTKVERLLSRQLKRAGLDRAEIAPEWRKFLDLVTEAYSEFERDRLILGRAMDLSSSEMDEAQAKLRDSIRIAEEACEAKGRFIANVSHELRTPLNGIIGLAELLKEVELPKEQGENLSLLSRSADQLLAIINDLLDISKIDAGKLSLISEPTSPARVFSDAVELFAPALRQRSIEYVFYVDQEVPAVVKIDSKRLSQVLMNLLGNAAKFTKSHGAVICVLRLAVANGSRNLRFSIADTGIGIPADSLDSIFSPFGQVDNSITRRFGGTGLGLSISKKIVELMKGEISVRSIMNVGTVFDVFLPLAEVDAAELADEKAFTNSVNAEIIANSIGSESRAEIKRHILIAEDNLVNQRVLAKVVERLGWTFVFANNGREAIERAKAEAFEIILMDCQMPEVSGYEAAVEIRKLSGYRETPIVACTAQASVGAESRCFASGMSDFISKPFHLETVKSCLLHWSEKLARSE